MSKSLEEHNHFGIDATIIADSITPQKHRLTTYVLTMPRIVLAEFNTHRMLSRNSASSRAIPFDKMVKRVKENPFVPIRWQKDHRGMQGSEYFSNDDLLTSPNRVRGKDTLKALEDEWLRARDWSVRAAKVLNKIGLTKQLCNRLLEPYLWHTVIATGTEWENFFALRAHEAAEIHIADLAYKMLQEYNDHTPQKLEEGEWHIPFGDKFDEDRVTRMVENDHDHELANTKELFKLVGDVHHEDICRLLEIKIATARCARVSYLNFEGKDDYRADVKLYDRLSNMGHWSPFEHCGRVMTKGEYNSYYSGVLGLDGDGYYTDPQAKKDYLGWSGNLQGFVQLRKMFDNENKEDPRVERVEV